MSRLLDNVGSVVKTTIAVTGLAITVALAVVFAARGTLGGGPSPAGLEAAGRSVVGTLEQITVPMPAPPGLVSDGWVGRLAGTRSAGLGSGSDGSSLTQLPGLEQPSGFVADPDPTEAPVGPRRRIATDTPGVRPQAELAEGRTTEEAAGAGGRDVAQDAPSQQDPSAVEPPVTGAAGRPSDPDPTPEPTAPPVDKDEDGTGDDSDEDKDADQDQDGQDGDDSDQGDPDEGGKGGDGSDDPDKGDDGDDKSDDDAGKDVAKPGKRLAKGRVARGKGADNGNAHGLDPELWKLIRALLTPLTDQRLGVEPDELGRLIDRWREDLEKRLEAERAKDEKAQEPSATPEDADDAGSGDPAAKSAPVAKSAQKAKAAPAANAAPAAAPQPTTKPAPSAAAAAPAPAAKPAATKAPTPQPAAKAAPAKAAPAKTAAPQPAAKPAAPKPAKPAVRATAPAPKPKAPAPAKVKANPGKGKSAKASAPAKAKPQGGKRDGHGDAHKGKGKGHGGGNGKGGGKDRGR